MSNSVYFRKVRVNKDTNSAVIIVSSAPLQTQESKIAGFSVGARTQQNLQFGILALTDPKTGESMKANHPTMVGLQKKLNPGDEIPGFRLSDNPITDRETGEAIPGLFWVEPA
jgi:hypothetical protein